MAAGDSQQDPRYGQMQAGEQTLAMQRLTDELHQLVQSMQVFQAFDPQAIVDSQQQLLNAFAEQGAHQSLPEGLVAAAGEGAVLGGPSTSPEAQALVNEQYERDVLARTNATAQETNRSAPPGGLDASETAAAAAEQHRGQRNERLTEALEGGIGAGLLGGFGGDEGFSLNPADILKYGAFAYGGQVAGGWLENRARNSAASDLGVPVEELPADADLGRTGWVGRQLQTAVGSGLLASQVGLLATQVGGIPASPDYLMGLAQQSGFSNAGGTLQDLPVVGGLARGAGFNVELPQSLQMLASALGLPGGSQAGDEANRRFMRSLRTRFGTAGVGTNDLMAIESLLARSGRLGPGADQGEGDDIYRALVATRAAGSRMRGASMEGMGDLALRMTQQGAATLGDFQRTIEEIPDAADAARMGLDEFLQATIQAGETFQQIGGTFAQGTQFARRWSMTTGLSPQTGTEVIQNPMVQGMLAGQTGLMPQLQGMLPTGTQIGGVEAVERMLRQSYRGMYSQGIPVQVGGEEVRLSGRQAENSLVAQGLGMTPDEYNRWRQNRGRIQARGELDTALTVWNAQRREAGGVTPRLLRSRDRTDGIVSAREMAPLMRRAGMGPERIRELQRMMKTDPTRATNQIRKFMTKQTAGDIDKVQKVQVEFAGEAAKWLREVRRRENKRLKAAEKAHKGQGASNSEFAGPGAPGTIGNDEPKGHDFINDMLNPQSIIPGAPTFDFDTAASDIAEGAQDLDDDVRRGLHDAAPWNW